MNQIDVLFNCMEQNKFYGNPKITKKDLKKYLESEAFDMQVLLDAAYKGKLVNGLPGDIAIVVIWNMFTKEDWTIEFAQSIYSADVVNHVLNDWARVVYGKAISYKSSNNIPADVSAAFTNIHMEKGFGLMMGPVIVVSADIKQEATIKQVREAIESFQNYAKERSVDGGQAGYACELKRTVVNFDTIECIFAVM